VIGADAVIRYQSPAIEQVLGYPAKDIIGRSFLDLVEPDDHANATQLFERSQMQPGVPTIGEVHMRSLGDEEAPRRFEMTATDLLDDPTVRGLVLNYRDITERALFQEWSTTASAMTPAINSSATPRNGWPAAYGRGTPSPAWAVTSSRCCCRTSPGNRVRDHFVGDSARRAGDRRGNRNGITALHTARARLQPWSRLPSRPSGPRRRAGHNAPDRQHHRGHGCRQTGSAAMSARG
jgi:PAS domain S-box-containing protein